MGLFHIFLHHFAPQFHIFQDLRLVQEQNVVRVGCCKPSDKVEAG